MTRRLKRPAMPGAGRPPLEDARRSAVLLRLTEDEHARYRAAAEAAALPLTEWLRAAAERAAAEPD